MRCAIICDKGFEEILAKELAKNTAISSMETKETMLLFDAENWIETLAEISYTFQGAIKVLSHVRELETDDFNKTKSSLDKTLTQEYQDSILSVSSLPLQIRCVRKGLHDFNSTDITSAVAREFFKEKDFKSQFIFFIYIYDEIGVCGIDFAGRDLHKRDYKIFLGAQTLRSTVAFGTFLSANPKKEDIIIDPFMGSGTIPIEAGLYFAQLSPFYFSKEKFTFPTVFSDVDWKMFFAKIDERRNTDKLNITGYDSLLKFLKNSQKNAKIADINKQISLTKVEVDWLDTKIDEKSIDKIITHPPVISENGSLTKILKVYKDFFKIADFLLKSNGTITLLASYKSFDQMKPIAESQGFKITMELDVNEGQEELLIGGFSRG